MEERTMVKLSADSGGVSVRTVSRGFKSPCSIFIGEERLQEFLEKGRCIIWQGLIAADMARHILPSGEECVKLILIWLSETGENSVHGHREQICLPYYEFLACMARRRDRNVQCVLSVPMRRRPEIVFLCRQRLKEVAGNRTLRKKFGRFLDRNLGQQRYKRIVLTDDCEPYSFGFACYTAEGLGTCGGIILHGRDGLKHASYQMHT